MKQDINLNKNYNLNFYICTFLFFIQIFVKRLFIIPSSYLVPFLYFFRFKFSSITYFYIVYIFYSIFITTDFLSLIIYSILFLTNTFIYNVINNQSSLIWIKLDKFHRLIRYTLIASTILSLLLFLLRINILPNKIYLTHFNPLNGLNMNSYIFILYFYSFLSIVFRKTKDFWYASALFLLSDSRTGFIMFSFSLIQFTINSGFIKKGYKIKKSILFSLFSITLISCFLIIGTSLNNRLINNFQSTLKFVNTDFIKFNEQNQLLSKAKLIDKSYTESNEARVCLTAVNILHIQKTFPFGTGIGLGSSQNSLVKNDLLCSSSKKVAIRGHNFYISYLAEMGIFFFPLLTFLVMHLRYKNSTFIILGLLIALIGQEYITMPYTWMILALSKKTN